MGIVDMTTTEKEVQIALGTYLPEAWKETCKLLAESEKLLAESEKLWDECDELFAEGEKLMAESEKLWDEGKTLWIDAVVEVYGSDIIKWIYNGCVVGGREFRYDY